MKRWAVRVEGGITARRRKGCQAAGAWVRGVVLALAAALAAPAGRAQVDDGPAVVAARLRPGERLRLDGRLSHPAWQRAPEFSGFVEKAPVTGKPPAHETRVRVLYDEQALYVGIDARDDRPDEIRAPLVRHDLVNRTQDFVVVYIDAIGRRQSAQFFRVNAAGSTADGLHTAADDSEDFAPDFDFDAAAARHDQGYSVVLRIPFASLRFSHEAAGPWRFMVARRVPREQFYLLTSVLVPREAPSFIAALQPLQGLQLPEQHQFLTLRPSLTWRRERDAPAGGPPQQRDRWAATLDAKWRPLPELVLDATLNPDFSQVALDVPQLAGNTRYALALQEKRPFFFESADLLRSPTDALYTRSLTEPRAGLRATWRGGRVAGTAFAIDDRGSGVVLLPGPYATGTADQPGSRVLAARLLGDGQALSDGLHWGGLVAARRYDDGRGDNQVAGPDLAWQLDGAWRLRAQWLASRSTALAAADGGLQRGPAVDGHRAFLKANYQTPSVEAEWLWDERSTGFRHDSGFVDQTGVRRAWARLARGWQPLGPFNDFWLNLEAEQVREIIGGRTIAQDLSPGVWLTGARNLEAWWYWHGAARRRVAADAPLLNQRYGVGHLTVTPAPWLPLLDAELKLGRLADVEAARLRPGGRLDLTLTTRPLARLEFEPQLSHAWLDDEQGRRVYRESAAQLLAVWHVDARQTLRAIVQRATLDRRAEPGVAAQQLASTVGSLTYAWRRSSGTVLYLGASRQRDGVAAVGRHNEGFIKLQLDVDEARRLF